MDRRKEAKLQYKMTERPKGIFQIRNLANGKILVAKSPNLDNAFNSYRFQLNFGSHMNKALQADWKALGEGNFVYEILDQLEASETPDRNDRKELEMLEELWLDKLQPYGERGYNTPKASPKYI